jgi:hypothetical protein
MPVDGISKDEKGKIKEEKKHNLCALCCSCTPFRITNEFISSHARSTKLFMPTAMSTAEFIWADKAWRISDMRLYREGLGW